VAALLTIVGYSLNDTIIVFDRIRETMQGQRREQFAEAVNVSICQTLSRTVLTSGTTLIVVLALFFFGGEVIHDFASALLIGIVVGTYSSIFIASPLLVFWNASARAQRLTLVPRKASDNRRAQRA
jgi:preprotein translocase subunit SecF